MVGEYGDVIFTSRLFLQQEGPHGGLSTQGKCSSLVEDTTATIEHDRQRCVMGTVQQTFSREVPIRGIHSTLAQRVQLLATG
jgi:hypothetical protein